jgi:transcriptional regulator with XRE-family HTH domain
MATRTRVRRSLASEDLDLARQVGARLKAARTRAGLTQRQLAEPRYTKAYVSALENGLIKPSMAALRFLARKLGTVPGEFLADADTHWQRIDAELRLATGDWRSAADLFRTILDTGPGGLERGLVLLGMAESTVRLERAVDAIGFATEASQLLTAARRPVEERRARYWLAAAYHLADDEDRATTILEELLAEPDDAADPQLRVRLLIALAAVVNHRGSPERAVALLEEARRMNVDLDDRRRATLLYSLAQSYRLTGDLEAAIRTGTETLALFRSIEAQAETGLIENELALTYLGLGNLEEAGRHVREARAMFADTADDFRLAHVVDTEAQIALGQQEPGRAAKLAAEAVVIAGRTKNHRAEISGLLTGARAARQAGDSATAIELIEHAASLAEQGPAPRLREVLTEWSELAAEAGDHARAYELSRRALAAH